WIDEPHDQRVRPLRSFDRADEHCSRRDMHEAPQRWERPRVLLDSLRAQGCLVGMCLLQDKRVLSLPGSPVRHHRILEDVGTQPLRLGGMERWAGMASAGSQVVAREPLDAAQQRQGHSAPRTPVAAWRGDHLILWQTAIEHGQAMGPIAQVYKAL